MSGAPTNGEDTSAAGETGREFAGQQRIEEALRDSESRYRALFEFAPDGIFILNVDHESVRFVDCNTYGAKLYRQKREKIIGRSPDEFSPPTQPDGQPSSEKTKALAAAAMAGEPQLFEWTHRLETGVLFQAEVRLSAIEVEHKRQLLAVVRDITERKSVEEERRRLTTIMEATSDFVSTSTIDGRLTYLNRAGKRMLGWDEEEDLTGRQIPDVHPDWAFEIVKYKGIPTAIEQSVWEGETALLGPEGEFPTSQVIMSHRAADGKLAFLSTIIRDISERKKAEKDLRESEERFRSLSDQSTMSIVITQAGRHRYVNQAAAEITGYSTEEMLAWKQEDLERLIHPDDAPFVLEQMRQKQAGELTQATHYAHRLVTKSGKVKWVEIHSKAIQYGGQLADMVTAVDITERKQAENFLQESEEKYRTLVERANDGILIVQDGIVKFANNQAARITGYTVEEMLDTMFLNYVYPDERPKIMKLHQSRLEGHNVPEIYELLGIHRDGSKVNLEVNSGVVSFQGETAVLSFIRDITSRKQVEQELTKHREHLEELVEERTAELSAARKVTEGINEVFKHALMCKTEEELAQTCLVVAEQLTSSKFGFIGEINREGRFDTIALSDPGWNACRMPKSDALVAIRNMELRGCWSKPLISGESLVVDDFGTHPEQVGAPEGHPPLTSFLGAPLKQGEKIIGLIALANKDSGYHEGDVKAVEALAGAFVEVLLRKRAELAEKARAEELRRAVSLMSGREERMAELKGVVKQLHTQLEEAGLKPVARDPLQEM